MTKQISLMGIIFCSITSVLISCHSPLSSERFPADTVRYGSIHLETGIPRDADTTDDYLILRSQYALSYNAKRNVPNWVSWNLNASWYGNAVRYSGNFISDTSLPSGFYRVRHDDYTNTGYDRGHMVRSEERTRNDADNRSTFILSNILPQTPELNRLGWLRLEEECERLCKENNRELYIMAGGIFRSGKTIGNRIAVPDSCWKIVVVLPQTGQRLKDITETASVIAVIMPNTSSAINDWKPYLTTITHIEQSTGYTFLRAVPEAVSTILRTKR